MFNLKKLTLSNKGLSLIELLIYLGILGIAGGILTGILTSVTKTEVEESTQVEITGQLNFAMQTIQRLVSDSSLIESESGISSSTLKLRTQNLLQDPTLIYLSGGRIYVKEGSSTEQSITSEKIVVDSLLFKKLSQYPGKDTVQIDMTMSGASQVEGKTLTRRLRSAIARASAATFDSDIVPGSDNTYSVGINPTTRWKNGAFAERVSVAAASPYGTLAIGGTDPSLNIGGSSSLGWLAQQITSDRRFRIYEQNSGANGERLTIETGGNVGIGTSNPAHNFEVAGTYASSSVSNVAKLGTPSFGSGAGDGIGLLFGASGGTDFGRITMNALGSGLVALDLGVWNGTAITDYLRIMKDGAVGIGTTNITDTASTTRLLIDGNVKLTGATPTYKITNVALPTDDSDAATKAYVDAASGSGSRQAFYYVPGTYTFSTSTRGTSVTTVYVTMCGGGGGGGGGYINSAENDCKGGGGGGSAACYYRYPITISTSTNYTITVGAGGDGGGGSYYNGSTWSSPRNGNDGGSSSFGALLTAIGGDDGEEANSSAPGEGGRNSVSPYPDNGQGGAIRDVELSISASGGKGGGNIFHPGGMGGQTISTPGATCTGALFEDDGGRGYLGSGGGGGSGKDFQEGSFKYSGDGADGGDGFVLVEWF